MTEGQYKTIACCIAGHCIDDTQFVYDGFFSFDGFRLDIRVQYSAGRRYWEMSPDKFKVLSWNIYSNNGKTVHFDPERLLRYLC